MFRISEWPEFSVHADLGENGCVRSRMELDIFTTYEREYLTHGRGTDWEVFEEGVESKRSLESNFCFRCQQLQLDLRWLLIGL